MSAPTPNSNQSINTAYNISATSPIDMSQVGMKRKVSDESSSVDVISHSGKSAADLSGTTPMTEMVVRLNGISKRIRSMPPYEMKLLTPVHHESLLHQLTDPESYPTSHSIRLASHYTVRQKSDSDRKIEQEATMRLCMNLGLNIMTPDQKGRKPLVNMCQSIREGNLPLTCFTMVLESQADTMDLSIVNDLVDPQLMEAPQTGPNRLLYWMIASQKAWGNNSLVPFATTLMQHPRLLIQLHRSTIVQALEYKCYNVWQPPVLTLDQWISSDLDWFYLPTRFERATIEAFQTHVKPLIQIHLINDLTEIVMWLLTDHRSPLELEEPLEEIRKRLSVHRLL